MNKYEKTLCGALIASSFLLPGSAFSVEVAAKVLSAEGEVFAETTTLKAGTPLKAGMKIGPGVTVSTKACSRAKLFLYPRGVAYLGPDSKLKLGKLEQPHKALGGMFRFIYSKAEEFKKALLSKGAFTATVTENATVGIRGTDYVLVRNPVLGETEIISLEGTLQLTNAGDISDSREVPAEHWGGLGGRFGEKTHDLIHLPESALESFKNALTWDTQVEGAKTAEDLNGEAVPEE